MNDPKPTFHRTAKERREASKVNTASSSPVSHSSRTAGVRPILPKLYATLRDSYPACSKWDDDKCNRWAKALIGYYTDAELEEALCVLIRLGANDNYPPNTARVAYHARDVRVASPGKTNRLALERQMREDGASDSQIDAAMGFAPLTAESAPKTPDAPQ